MLIGIKSEEKGEKYILKCSAKTDHEGDVRKDLGRDMRDSKCSRVK